MLMLVSSRIDLHRTASGGPQVQAEETEDVSECTPKDGNSWVLRTYH
jgi:hypothetical protein